MTGIEKITEKILADAKARAREILAQAQNECREAAEAFAARAEESREAITARALAEGEAVAARARAAATMERRDILLAARARMLDEAFAKAREQITATDYGKYRELLTALLSCALIDLSKSERVRELLADGAPALEVLMNAEDAARFGPAVLTAARRVTERKVGAALLDKLTLSAEHADIEGGLLLRYGNTECDCSITVLLDEVRRDIEHRVAKILLGDTEA
jgi:V/A-type H+-transporting ATPase subunit E